MLRLGLRRLIGGLMVNVGGKLYVENPASTEMRTAPARIHPSEALGLLFFQVPAMIESIRRWTHFASLPREECETVLAHSWCAPTLTGAMLALEEKHGHHKGKLNHARLLLAALFHDVGEGRIGDVRYAVKGDSRVKKQLRIIEKEQVQQLFAGLPPEVRDVFWDAYCLEDEESLDAEFFNAVERMGYMYFAVPQVRRGRMEFIEVFRLQHPKILELEKKFVSLRMLYDPYRDEVAEVLALEDRAAKLRESVGANGVVAA